MYLDLLGMGLFSVLVSEFNLFLNEFIVINDC